MALKDTIQNDMKAALLSGDRFVGDTLRNLKAAILDEEVKQNKREEGLSDEDIEKVIAREVKKRSESAAIYTQNARPELAETEQKEAAVLVKYLPEQVGENEIREVVAAKVTELSASGPQAMGQVIGAVKQQLGNSADGALIARIVKEILV
jgi:uncharacterized protein YqeY